MSVACSFGKSPCLSAESEVMWHKGKDNIQQRAKVGTMAVTSNHISVIQTSLTNVSI